MPEEYQGYIKEWQTLHPDWEIKRWDESNSPMDAPYLQNAHQGNFYSNMSNYIRLYAIKEFGGVYLDTDIKLIKSLTPFLSDACFIGFEEGGENTTLISINNAVCGAEKQHYFINDCFQTLIKEFDGTEQSNLSGPKLTTKMLEAKGLTQYGKQKIENIVLYPKEYFSPVPWYLAKNTRIYSEFITEETVAVHMWSRSWFTREMMLKMIDDLQIWSTDQSKYISDLKNGLEYEQSRIKVYEEQTKQIKNERNAIIDIAINDRDTIKELLSSANDYQNKIFNVYDTHLSRFNSLLSIFTHIQEKQSEQEVVITGLQQTNNKILEHQKSIGYEQATMAIKFKQEVLNVEKRISAVQESINKIEEILQKINHNISTHSVLHGEAMNKTENALLNLDHKINNQTEENRYLLSNVIRSFTQSCNERSSIIKEQKELLSQKQMEISESNIHIKDLQSLLHEKEESIKWYQRTYEFRSFFGVIKQKLLKK